MKKLFVLFCALFALVACNIDPLEVDDQFNSNGNQVIKVNLNITRAGIEGETKATVKTGWANNDVIFVFVQGQEAPKYLELKYNTATGWIATPKNDITLPGSGTMTAVYLPYGSNYAVAADGTSFTIKNSVDENYSGHFYVSVQQPFTYEGGALSGTLHLTAAAPDNSSDKLVHFDVTGYTDGHTYDLYQEYMKPLNLTSISSTGGIATAIGSKGDAIIGYVDAGNSIVSFSGVLDNSAVGSAKNYWFSIRDTESGILYYRDAGSQTIDVNKYIGLGKLNKWSVATPGAFTVNADGDKVTIARSNLSYLGATGGTKPWQLQKYPWSTIYVGPTGTIFTPASNVDFDLLGWATSGYKDYHADNDPWKCHPDASNTYGPGINGNHPAVEWSYVNTEDPTDVNAKGGSVKWDWAVYNTIYEYGGNTALTGYRTPTKNDWDYILKTRSGNRFVEATVGGKWGLIFFPDNFVNPGVTISNPNFVDTDHSQGFRPSSNTYNALDWNKLEATGAVFLPCAGYRAGSTGKMTNVPSYGGYWTTTVGDSQYAYELVLDYNSSADNIAVQGVLRYHGLCVRLVKDL